LSGELLDLCVGIIVLVKYNSLGFGWNRGFGAVFFFKSLFKDHKNNVLVQCCKSK
jgi:hypothetical protein